MERMSLLPSLALQLLLLQLAGPALNNMYTIAEFSNHQPDIFFLVLVELNHLQVDCGQHKSMMRFHLLRNHHVRSTRSVW